MCGTTLLLYMSKLMCIVSVYLNIMNATHAGMFKVMYDCTQHSSNNGITHYKIRTLEQYSYVFFIPFAEKWILEVDAEVNTHME